MKIKKFIALSSAVTVLSLSSACGVPQNTVADLNQVAKVAEVNITKNNEPVAPKIKIKIKKAEIEVSEADLNVQLKSILELSDEKRIKDTVMSVKPNNMIFANGIIEQKIPLTSKPLRVPFNIEGKLSSQPKNVIKFEVTKVKVAGIPVKTFMDVLGLELANFTKFKDKYGRIELSGNSFLLIIEKFTDDAIIDGQIKDVQTSDKAISVYF